MKKCLFILGVFILVSFMPLSVIAETNEEEAARRMPPVFYSGEIPEYLVSGETVTIKWSILGYHDSYNAEVAFFYGSGGSYKNNFEASGELNHVSTESGTWSFSGINSTIFNYEYEFTPPQVTNPTNIVIRFYRVNSIDDANGKSGLSLLIPGKVSDRYYDTSGRRIVKTIYPSNPQAVGTNPDTDGSPYTTNNPFHPSYNGQCTWFVWGRVNEIIGVNIQTTGNAKTWWVNTSLPKGKSPLPDSIAVWNNDRQGSSSNAGHVAYVEYLDNNNIYYNEANEETYGSSTIAGCSGCGGGYDGSLDSDTMEDFENRGTGTGILQGFIYPAINVYDWWIKSSTTNHGEDWDAQFKVENLGSSPLVIENARVGVYKQSGVYVGSTIMKSNTSSVLESGENYHHGFGKMKMDHAGRYYAQPEIQVNGEWIVIGNKQSFRVY